MKEGGKRQAVGTNETKTPRARMAQKGTVKTYEFESNTKSKLTTGRALLAKGSFQGPGGNMLNGKADDDANDAEFAAFKDASVQVTAFICNPPAEQDASGAFDMTGVTLTPVAPYSVNCFEAWLYGVSLKASGKVRQIATAGEVDDHVLSIGRQSTDLDAMSAKDLAKSLNGLRAALAAGMSFGPSNEAKIASKVAQAIEAGMIVEKDGTLTVK